MTHYLNPIGRGLLAVLLLAAADASFGQYVRGVRSNYDRGAQAYFAGRSSEAEALLSEAMGDDPDDPRPYYFRALSLLRQGRTDEARGDMMLGAALESQNPERYAVGSALQRVQGCDRMMLEKFRREGRAASAATRAQAHRQRQHHISIQDSEVLREPVVIPLDELLRPEGPRALSPQELAHRAASEAERGRAADRPGALNARPPVEDPFREDAAVPPAVAAPPETPAEESEPQPATGPAEEMDSSEDPFDFGN